MEVMPSDSVIPLVMHRLFPRRINSPSSTPSYASLITGSAFDDDRSSGTSGEPFVRS